MWPWLRAEPFRHTLRTEAGLRRERTGALLTLQQEVSNPDSAGRAWESLLQEVVSRLRRDQRGKLHSWDGVAGALAAKEDMVREGQEELQE